METNYKQIEIDFEYSKMHVVSMPNTRLAKIEIVEPSTSFYKIVQNIIKKIPIKISFLKLSKRQKNKIKKMLKDFFFGKPIKGKRIRKPTYRTLLPPNYISYDQWIKTANSKSYNQWLQYIRSQIK
jgi:hypothetical protein